jgi:putative addiction module component (TIGR02574 family)
MVPQRLSLPCICCYDFLIRESEEDEMAATMKDLGIDRLTPAERIALALEIWESLGEAQPPGRLTAEQNAELARRDAELTANPESALTWEQVRASVEAKP